MDIHYLNLLSEYLYICTDIWIMYPRIGPLRPGGDYDVSLNYRVEDEYQYGESSAARMIKGAIAEADAQD